MNQIAFTAYKELYGKDPTINLELKFHGNLKGYNASVRKSAFTITFTLSKKFETCENEVQIGVMQFLLNKLYKTKIKTDNIDFYHSFIKNMSNLAPITKNDPTLEQSYLRMNEKFFSGLMTRPNLMWGQDNFRLLGTYTYGTDTIMISRILEQVDQETLDYVVYHEMLHKKHKFSNTGSRTHSHTKAFRNDEKMFVRHDKQEPELALRKALQKAKRAYNKQEKFTAQNTNKDIDDKSFIERLLDYF